MGAKKTKKAKLAKVKLQVALDQASQARAAMEVAQDHTWPMREAAARIAGAQSARVNDFIRITDAVMGRGTVIMITGETAVAVCAALRREGVLRDGSRVV